MPASEIFKYDIGRLHKVFLLVVVVFGAATALVMYVDHNDEWRSYQRKFYRIEASLLEREVDAIYAKSGGSERFNEETASLHNQIRAVDRVLNESTTEVRDLEQKIESLERDYMLKGRTVRFQRAKRDVSRANLDLAIRDSRPESSLQQLTAAFKEAQELVQQFETEWERIGTSAKDLKKQLSAKTFELAELKDSVKKRVAEVSRTQDAINDIDPKNGLRLIKRTMMELPIIDGFHGHLTPKQDWLPDLKIKLGMTSTARFDRCRTCHLGIDRYGSGDVATFPRKASDGSGFEQPFSSHPRPDVYLTATSPHPISSFGCTICHDGAGSATSFLNAQHGPNDPHQEHEWGSRYKHHYNHFWEYPMHPARLREVGCVKCHHEIIELGVNNKFGSTAPKLYEGWKLVSDLGCYGCHEINGYDGKSQIGPDLRLEPNREEEAKFAADTNLKPGNMRKVGPSLEHIAQKTTSSWISYWTEEPKRFRSTTRMPQFFGLSNSVDHKGLALSKAEIAGISSFLMNQSTDIKLREPRVGYVPDVQRGRIAFAEKGCLACHSHDGEEFKDAKADFGPNLSNLQNKVSKGTKGFNWLYSWILDPEAYNTRTRMPQLFIPTDVEGIDTAADISAFLLTGPTTSYEEAAYSTDSIIELLRLNLSGRVMTADQFEQFIVNKCWPEGVDGVKGDEVDIARSLNGSRDAGVWEQAVLNYIGKRSISRYGCYGCHDINGFGMSRPIGTGLAEWGRKDTGRLAFEHIQEFLSHHGESEGGSTQKFVTETMKAASSGSFQNDEERETGLRKAFYYESLQHHGRPGFIFQKLRDSRSYDYKKIDTKAYNERLVMPKFNLNEAQIESIATFVLGLVSDPPATKYIYRPSKEKTAEHQGERVLRKYNCISCHSTKHEEISFAVAADELQPTALSPSEHESGKVALLKVLPSAKVFTGGYKRIGNDELKVAAFHGVTLSYPNLDDEPGDRQYTFDVWRPADLGALNKEVDPTKLIMPGSQEGRLQIPEKSVVSHTVHESGAFARWLTTWLRSSRSLSSSFPAMQMSPPNLVGEGRKVQSKWLYQFLLRPEQIRHTPVLRMPKFNLSATEAGQLSEYFAAASDGSFPFEEGFDATIDRSAPYGIKHPQRAQINSYESEVWTLLTARLCMNCHAVGGRPFVSAPNNPNVTRGPNLENVNGRLRSDWVKAWVSKPQWLTPYTSMPLPFAKDKQSYIPLFDGDASDQTDAVHYGLMNYQRLSEKRLILESLELAK